MRLGTAAAIAMYLLMWTVVLPPENNPIIDDHIMGAVVVLVLGLLGAGRYLGLGTWWHKQDDRAPLPRVAIDPTDRADRPRPVRPSALR